MGKNKNKGNKRGNGNKQDDIDNENELIELAISENAKLPKPEYVKIIPPKDNKYPFVSVCTPTFNRRPFIPAMLKNGTMNSVKLRLNLRISRTPSFFTRVCITPWLRQTS